MSSQSVAYAGQEGSAQPEENSTEETTEDGKTSEDVDTASTEIPTQSEKESEENSTEETTRDRENEEESVNASPETSEQPGKESTEDGETSEETDTVVLETSEQPEKESVENGKTDEETDTVISETAEQTEDSSMANSVEISTEELETGEDMDTESQEIKLLSEDIPIERSIIKPEIPDVDVSSLTPAKVYAAMTALENMEGYREGDPWTNTVPYSGTGDDVYRWAGGTIGGVNIVAVGCVAFAFTLSDAAFGNLQARMYAEGEFTYDDIKVGDILRVNNDTHTVIVLEVSDAGVVVAEGNIGTGDYQNKVHWGRGISKEEVMSSTSHYITRYPDGYVAPDDPTANESIGKGVLDGGLAWNLTKAGTLTISGSGPMPDFSGTGEQQWNQYSSQIRKVVIGNGVTKVGAYAFWNCGVLSAEISSSVTAIGNSAFRDTSLMSVTIPSSVKTIGDSAFQACQGLSSVTVSDGVEIICQNAFSGCTNLKSISLPASIEEVGSAAFFQCAEMTSATFASGSKQVKMGDNLFTQCYKLMSVKLPQNIDRIGEGMFQNCRMLPGVEIPQGAESIGGSAFASCLGMSVVIIPDSVTTIGIAAFSNSPLTDIYYTGTEAQWNSISKIGDTASAVSKATMHYNYVPVTNPDPDEGDNDDNSGGDTGDNDDSNTGDNDNPGDNNPGDGSSTDDNNPGDDSSTGDNNNSTEDDNNFGDNNGGDNDDNNNTGDNNTGGNSNAGDSNSNNSGNNNNTEGNNPGEGGDNNPGNNHDSVRPGNNSRKDQSDESTPKAAAWKPTTPDEIRRYGFVGKEEVQYTLPEENAYPIDVENAMQGPMCFQAFELVLGDYTIGRTYNIYAVSDTIYSTDQEVQITLEIPPALYKKDREYKMICVTEGGQPIVYDDLDNDPGTITIKTNRYFAYALIYK